MELDKSNLNYQAKMQELFGENQILLHENNKLIKQRNDYKQQRDELIEDISEYRKALYVFARLVKNKLDINASGRYIQYQHMLDDIGINADELESD